MTKQRYNHSISLTEDQEQRLKKLQAGGWTIIDIFTRGADSIEGIVTKTKRMVEQEIDKQKRK